MLTQLRFQNFKSWRDTGDIRIAPITGIFGTNSSGKTAILQFLLMLKQTVETLDSRRILHLGDENTYINLGTSYDIAHCHQLPTEINYSLHWQPCLSGNDIFLPNFLADSNSSIQLLPLTYKGNVWFDAKVELKIDEIFLHEFSYGYKTLNSYAGLGIRLLSNHNGDQAYTLVPKGELKELPNWQSVVDSYTNLDELPFSPSKNYGFPTLARYMVESRLKTKLVSQLENTYEQLFQRLFYLGPLRDYPRRLYLWSGEKPQDVGKRGELAIAALLGSRKDNPDLELKVAHWLKELGLIHGFRVQPIAEHRQNYEVLVQCAPHAPEVLITDVGFGVSQVLPVLVLCYYVPKGSVVLLEQPEIHLHPSVQARLADVLIDAIETRQIRIIVESHSEHLLHRLQRRIAEEKLAVEDAALYFCQMDDTGESHLESLQLDPYGNITNWPPNFFGDDMEDLVKMTEAEMRRQGAMVED